MTIRIPFATIQLALYYVSWKLAIPEMLEKLQLPYDAEYEMATGLVNQGRP